MATDSTVAVIHIDMRAHDERPIGGNERAGAKMKVPVVHGTVSTKPSARVSCEAALHIGKQNGSVKVESHTDERQAGFDEEPPRCDNLEDERHPVVGLHGP